jgi:hypothetical protein
MLHISIYCQFFINNFFELKNYTLLSWADFSCFGNKDEKAQYELVPLSGPRQGAAKGVLDDDPLEGWKKIFVMPVWQNDWNADFNEKRNIDGK